MMMMMKRWVLFRKEKSGREKEHVHVEIIMGRVTGRR